MVRLALPFSAAVICFLAALVASSMNATGLRDALAWAMLIFLALGLALVCIYAVTRFVVWASKR